MSVLVHLFKVHFVEVADPGENDTIGELPHIVQMLLKDRWVSFGGRTVVGIWCQGGKLALREVVGFDGDFGLRTPVLRWQHAVKPAEGAIDWRNPHWCSA